ncbi:MAG: hypothetical protein H6Q35_2394 [Proteobacteria bacterium]|nr:hypothetical protein [Pseudomonadota bacterium]
MNIISIKLDANGELSVNLQDVTINQHFVPQIEQRLNAINPSDNKKKQKIYSFSLIDRESYSIHLDSEEGSKIVKTLSLNDIFSFDVLDREPTRYNFEKLFYQYEANIKSNTESLISKLSCPSADIKSEILNIFLSKFLNFVRNPYSIKKVLKTFASLKNKYPTNPLHHKNFERVLNGRKPHQSYLCKQLNISEEEYRDWLAMIFLSLSSFKENQPNFLEQMIKGYYEDPEIYIGVMIYTYDDKTCLLSDRGYSFPFPENEHQAWDFNLYSHGFIRYAFIDEALTSKRTPQNIVEKYKAAPKSIKLHHIINDLSALEQYNKHVVSQCHQKVFNSSSECYGI